MKKTIRPFDLGARLCLLAFCLHLPLATRAAVTDSTAPKTLALVTGTNKPAAFRVKSGQDDGRIAFLTAYLLEKIHFSHHSFDEEISSQFLDRYIESLDPQHLHFLQSDLAQFERFRTKLGTMTMTSTGVADVTPAFEIFSCFLERMQQRVDYCDELLKTEKFAFDADDRIAVDRREAANPKELNEAKALWRQRLRYEYLQEKLALDPDKSATASANPKTAPPAADKKPAVKNPHDQIVDTLSHRYHRNLRLFTDWDNEDVRSVYLTALAHVYDPHSDYFNKAQMDSFAISMNLELFGIGAELRSEDGYCKIERLLPGPALKSNKIHERDRIVAVAQSNQPPVDVVEMSLNKVVQLIRGPKGTEVRLTVLPAGADAAERTVVTIIRDEIQLEDQAAKGKIIEIPDGKGAKLRLGVIDLLSFYATMDKLKPTEFATGAKGEMVGNAALSTSRSTSVDVARLVNKFKQENVNGIILDLRRNGGGSLDEAIKLTGLFIKEGPVVQVRELSGRVQSDGDTDPTMLYDGPLVVLTSRFSASASEIVAGALQDYGRALIVGDTSTHGKGTVQSLNSLTNFVRPDEFSSTDPGGLKFTIRKFYRATGASTQLQGVMPDIVLPSRLNYAKDIGESSLENPLPPDTVPSARFEKLSMVQPYLSDLLKRSTDRISTNQDFAYIREDIEQFRRLQDEKTISLNEKERLKEKEENDARQKARDKEVRARPEPNEKVYEITLKQAALPGLPPPVQKTNSVAMTTGTATNSVAVASGKPADATDDDPEVKPGVDPGLTETRQILMDYILLMSSNRGVAATATTPAATRN